MIRHLDARMSLLLSKHPVVQESASDAIGGYEECNRLTLTLGLGLPVSDF